MQGLQVSNPAGGKDVSVVCVLKTKGKTQDKEKAETSTDKEQRENKRIKKSRRGHGCLRCKKKVT